MTVKNHSQHILIFMTKYQVLWLSIDQISNLPNDNCSREFKEVVSKLNRRRNYFEDHPSNEKCSQTYDRR